MLRGGELATLRTESLILMEVALNKVDLNGEKEKKTRLTILATKYATVKITPAIRGTFTLDLHSQEGCESLFLG